MLRSSVLAALAVAMTVVLAVPPPVEAGAGLHDEAPDPYAYRYKPRGYYPYYGARREWRPLADLRYRYRYDRALPEYKPGWGYPRKWNHREWHREHHGRHWPWHW